MLFHWSFIPAIILSAVWIHRTVHAIHTVLTTPTLSPETSPSSDIRPPLSILIPARNEEKNIANCIQSLLPQLNSADRIIVINDRSTDRTEEILQNLGAKPINLAADNDLLTYLHLDHTDTAWTGKNYALNQARPYLRGDWLLFTDADTIHYPGSLNAAVAYAVKNQVDYLTLWPQCVTKSFWEHVIQTCSLSYIGLWFPTQKINDPKSEKYFANGQYALIRRTHYHKIGGHEAVKEAFLEDFAMMKKTKESGARGIVAIGAHVYGTHMYDGLESIWKGWRRIYQHGFESNPVALILKSIDLILFSVLPFLVFPWLFFTARNHPELFWSEITLILTLGIIFAVAWKASGVIRARRIYSLLHPIGAFVLAMIFIDAAHMALTKKKTVWR